MCEKTMSLPKGHPNPQGFKRGHDPRRWMDGPRPESFDNRAKAIRLLPKAIDKAEQMLDDPTTPPGVVSDLVKFVWNQGLGESIKRHLHGQVDGGGMPAMEMPLDQLMAQVQKMLPPVTDGVTNDWEAAEVVDCTRTIDQLEGDDD